MRTDLDREHSLWMIAQRRASRIGHVERVLPEVVAEVYGAPSRLRHLRASRVGELKTGLAGWNEASRTVMVPRWSLQALGTLLVFALSSPSERAARGRPPILLSDLEYRLIAESLTSLAHEGAHTIERETGPDADVVANQRTLNYFFRSTWAAGLEEALAEMGALIVVVRMADSLLRRLGVEASRRAEVIGHIAEHLPEQEYGGQIRTVTPVLGLVATTVGSSMDDLVLAMIADGRQEEALHGVMDRVVVARGWSTLLPSQRAAIRDALERPLVVALTTLSAEWSDARLRQSRSPDDWELRGSRLGAQALEQTRRAVAVCERYAGECHLRNQTAGAEDRNRFGEVAALRNTELTLLFEQLCSAVQSVYGLTIVPDTLDLAQANAAHPTPWSRLGVPEESILHFLHPRDDSSAASHRTARVTLANDIRYLIGRVLVGAGRGDAQSVREAIRQRRESRYGRILMRGLPRIVSAQAREVMTQMGLDAIDPEILNVPDGRPSDAMVELVRGLLTAVSAVTAQPVEAIAVELLAGSASPKAIDALAWWVAEQRARPGENVRDIADNVTAALVTPLSQFQAAHGSATSAERRNTAVWRHMAASLVVTGTQALFEAIPVETSRLNSLDVG